MYGRDSLEMPEIVADQFFLGLDLGQAHDFSAISILRRIDRAPLKAGYELGFLQRLPLETSYPAVVNRVKALLSAPELAGNVKLVVDGTGVGAAVVDMLRHEKLSPIAITITGGSMVSAVSGGYHVPKRDLVSQLQVALQTQRLKIAGGLPEAQTLAKELLAFRVTVSPAGHDSYGNDVRENPNDDLVLSVAVALWFAERKGYQRKPRTFQG